MENVKPGIVLSALDFLGVAKLRRSRKRSAVEEAEISHMGSVLPVSD